MSKWTLTKEFTFEAAHKLEHHDGKCARLHGHSWKGRVIVSGDCLESYGPKTGMLVDYGDIKAWLAKLIDIYLDHRYLNETLVTESPTSELVARWLYHAVKSRIGQYLQTDRDAPNLQLVAVEINETCTSSCRYEE
jgi:6-pyruvoyltetrahydropterin/6-carboxytetrahydropterin synthase